VALDDGNVADLEVVCDTLLLLADPAVSVPAERDLSVTDGHLTALNLQTIHWCQ